ncbi:hypothetical protein HK104_007925 [Borealophlyctis nickersoniae]|nr:hypothetical protein HK104_007925 [Borealophlyctis nickersoniae]
MSAWSEPLVLSPEQIVHVFESALSMLLDNQHVNIHAVNDRALLAAVQFEAVFRRIAAPEPRRGVRRFFWPMQVNVVSMLLKRGASSNALDGEPLRLAISYCTHSRGNTNVVKCLFSYGATLKTWPFASSSLAGHNSDVASVVVHHIAANGSPDLKGQALVQLSRDGRENEIKILLDASADIHYDDDAAVRSACQSGHKRIVQLLVENGANIHAMHDSALRQAALKDKVDVVQWLLENGANVHANDDAALQDAAFAHNVKVVALLLARGANVHAGNEGPLKGSLGRGKNLWGSVKKEENLEVVKLLLEHGASANALDDGDLVNCSATMIMLLAKYGLHLHARLDKLFQLAVAVRNISLAQAFLEGALANGLPHPDVHLNDDAALKAAADSPELVKLLLKHGANIHAENDKVLFRAIETGTAEVVILLLKKGANVNVIDDEMMLKLESPAMEGCRKLIEQLRK